MVTGPKHGQATARHCEMAEGLGLETLGRRSRSERLRPKAIALFAFSLVAVEAIAAGRPAVEQAKIDWLLSEVGNSVAVFIRNGKEYDGAQAVSHLKMKLFFAGRRVQTVRQFIVGVASRSEASGKPYEIRLPDGKQGPLQTWLLERLSVYKKGERR